MINRIFTSSHLPLYVKPPVVVNVLLLERSDVLGRLARQGTGV